MNTTCYREKSIAPGFAAAGAARYRRWIRQICVWLSENGYEVHLVDPVQRHVEQAREASASQLDHPLASITQGDARSLHHRDGSADTVLCMGPLYHLHIRDQRMAALGEARRVLKPGGVLVAQGINRFASLMDGVRLGF